jgi:hypothetical protein
MTDRQPTDIKNLDIYGDAPLEWSRIVDALQNPPPNLTHFLSTVRPDGRPHTVGVGAMYDEGDYYVVTGPGTRRARNIALNSSVTLAVQLTGVDLVFEGDVARVTDTQTLERLAARYNDTGWPVHVEGDSFVAPYSAPSAGPPPWHVYRLTFQTVFAVASTEPYGATRWRFNR